MPVMLERVWRCPYCGGEITGEAAMEQPFCNRCVNERLRKAGEAAGPVTWKREGDYLVPVREPRNG